VHGVRIAPDKELWMFSGFALRQWPKWAGLIAYPGEMKDFRYCEGFRMPADDGRRRERCG